MKFSEKLIWTCLLILFIVFSIGASFMLLQNHQHLLSNTIEKNLSANEMDVFHLETKLEQDSHLSITHFGDDQEELLNQAYYYLEQFHHMSYQQDVSYALLQNKKIIFSNMNNQYHSLIQSNQQSYYIKKYHSDHFMLITVNIHIGKEVYDLTTCYSLNDCFKERDRQIHSFLLISFFVFIFSLLILKLVLHYMTSSIRTLNLVSQRIAEGQYSERTHIQSEDEIGELSASFDKMAEMNESKIKQLQESIEQKEEFMGSFSHEIKTPMTAIMGFADLLRTYDCDEETRQTAAQYIYIEAKRLEKLSYTLMDLLSLSHQKIELKPVSIQNVFSQLKKYYAGKKIDVDFVFDQTDMIVLSQLDLLFVLLRNLIDNAIKASQKGQCIEINLFQQDTKLKISVKDMGIGMNEEDVRKATEAFYMADKSRARLQGGAGLGLNIVKRICDLHHTDLLIDSKLNEGTTVSFMLEVCYEENENKDHG